MAGRSLEGLSCSAVLVTTTVTSSTTWSTASRDRSARASNPIQAIPSRSAAERQLDMEESEGADTSATLIKAGGAGLRQGCGGAAHEEQGAIEQGDELMAGKVLACPRQARCKCFHPRLGTHGVGGRRRRQNPSRPQGIDDVKPDRSEGSASASSARTAARHVPARCSRDPDRRGKVIQGRTPRSLLRSAVARSWRR